MKILLCSYAFAPSVGGIETNSWILAEQFSRLGSSVTLVTQTPGETASTTYEIVRRPSLRTLRRLARRADIIFQNNISLQTLLPLQFCGKPIVITHHTYLTRTDGTLGWQDRVKRVLLRAFHNVAGAKAIADTLPVRSKMIDNVFQSDEFTFDEGQVRDRDIVFMGRLVSDKGCDVALRALSRLKSEGVYPSFTVIGDGPEMPALRRLTEELGLQEQVEFRGAMREGRGREVARHKIMVIPSVWPEPFGLVAVEGLAAGCVSAASNVGGLPEAVGPCGLLFPKGDAEALAAILKTLVADSCLREQLLAQRDNHLRRFHPEVVARNYLEFFATVVRDHSRSSILRRAKKD